MVGVVTTTKIPTATNEDSLIGAELTFGAAPIGHVLGVVRDPLSQRVGRLITTYGPTGRRVAVPMEWVTKRTPTRLELGVGPRSLDDLPERIDAVRVLEPR
jgi:hypothetical protein